MQQIIFTNHYIFDALYRDNTITRKANPSLRRYNTSVPTYP